MSSNANGLEPLPLADAISFLLDVVESLPGAEEIGTDLWAAVFIARESLRAATLSEPTKEVRS